MIILSDDKMTSCHQPFDFEMFGLNEVIDKNFYFEITLSVWVNDTKVQQTQESVMLLSPLVNVMSYISRVSVCIKPDREISFFQTTKDNISQ